LELQKSNNFPVEYLNDMVLLEKMEEVNNVVKKNIEYDIEQRK
jgi:hypothetical protein